MQAYIESWRLGVKAIAIYRDNCKVAQPLSKKGDAGATTLAPVASSTAASDSSKSSLQIAESRSTPSTSWVRLVNLPAFQELINLRLKRPRSIILIRHHR